MNGMRPWAGDEWTKVRLGDVVRVSGAQVKPWLSPDQDFPYVSLEDIEAGTGRILDLRPTAGREIASAKTRFQRGDILYGRLRPYLQKVVIAPFDGVAATELLVLRPHGPVDPEFLHEALLGTEHKDQITRLMSGARMPRVRSEQLLDLPLMLPALPTQRRIARAMSVLRHRVEILRGRLAEADELAARFDRSMLSAAFDGRLSIAIREGLDEVTGADLLKKVAAKRQETWEIGKSRAEAYGVPGGAGGYSEASPPDIPARSAALPSTWTWASLSEIASAADPICYGIVQPGEDVESGVPLVRVQDIEGGGVNPNRMRRVSEEIDRRYSRSRLKGGEILVSLVGTVVGQIARVPPDLAGANIARAIAKVTPSDPDLEEWVALVLQSPALQAWLMGSARGVARNTLNLSRLARAPIPLAPAAERAWILDQLRRRRTTLAGLQKRVEDTAISLNALWTTVHSRAISGTAQLADPADEAVEAARATRAPKAETSDGRGGGRVRRAPATKQKFGDPAARKDLKSVLEEHPQGLEPIRLLEEAGYGLHDVEAFFTALSDATVKGRVKELRSDGDWPVLVAT